MRFHSQKSAELGLEPRASGPQGGVLGTQHHVQQTLRSTHNLTVKRRGLMPSFTQRLPGIGFQLSQAHDEQ